MMVSLLAMAVTSIAVAAVPSVYLSVAATPPRATAGQPIGFTITVDNRDNSTVAQATVEATVPGGTTYSGVYPASTSCSEAGGVVTCNLGNLPGMTKVTYALVFTTTTAGTSATTTVTGSTTGGPTTDGGNSHGDNFLCNPSTVCTATTNLVTYNDPNFNGRFATDTSDVSTLGINAGGGLQSTSITPPRAGIAVTAADGAQASTPLGDPCHDLCWGEYSQLNVDNGNRVGPFKVVIEVDKAQVPPGVNQKNMKVVHINDAGELCTLNVNCLAGESSTVSKIPGGNYRITLILLTNGWVGHI